MQLVAYSRDMAFQDRCVLYHGLNLSHAEGIPQGGQVSFDGCFEQGHLFNSIKFSAPYLSQGIFHLHGGLLAGLVNQDPSGVEQPV